MGGRKLQVSLVVLGALVAGVTSAASAATPSKDLLACQTRFKSKVNAFARFTANKIHVCTEKVVKCKLSGEITPTIDTTNCLAAATTTCGAMPAVVANKQALAKSKIELRCGGDGSIPFSDLGPFIAGLGFSNVAAGCSTAATLGDLVDCVLNGTRCAVERKVFIRDPRAQDSLTQVGIAGSFPCVAPVPTATPIPTPTEIPTNTP
jgi:hypothetical protein